jgi:Tfp pilus assembly protein PilN
MTELNLIPYSLKKKRKNKLMITQYVCVGILILCVLFLGLYYPMNTLSGLRAKEELLKIQVTPYQSMINEEQSIKNDISVLNKFISKVNALTSTKVSVVDRIRGLQALIPLDIVFTSCNYSNNIISISGLATKYSSISEFAANLQTSQNYSGAEILNINFDEANNNYSFSLTIR